MLQKGLKEIGILKNDRDNGYHQLNPTSIGHYLGIDVHDCSMITYDRILEPGVVELYDLILETNKECVKLCKPGTSLRDIDNFSIDMLRKGLKEIGILKNDRDNRYHQLNPTSIGHYLGMDVHDCSTITYDRILEPGVVITIEPGVYIPYDFDGPERYRGIGMRIEDEVLITESGYEVLTGSLPKEINHIESLLNDYSHGIRAGAGNSKIMQAASS